MPQSNVVMPCPFRAGKAGLSLAISARGMAILPPIEIEAGEFVRQSVDVLDPKVQAHLKMLIEAKLIFIHFLYSFWHTLL